MSFPPPGMADLRPENLMVSISITRNDCPCCAGIPEGLDLTDKGFDALVDVFGEDTLQSLMSVPPPGMADLRPEDLLIPSTTADQPKVQPMSQPMQRSQQHHQQQHSHGLPPNNAAVAAAADAAVKHAAATDSRPPDLWLALR